MVQVYSHPPSRTHLWRLNGTEISASDQGFAMEGPLISGNTSNFSLTILHARCDTFIVAMHAFVNVDMTLLHHVMITFM